MWPLFGILGLVMGVGLAGCGSGRSQPTATVEGRIGHLEVVDAFLPDPASPSVAAMYLTVRNSGSAADELIGVSSPEARTAMLMTEDQQGAVGAMAMLKDLAIPAHGQASLVPGHDHAMLENPTVTFKVGELVPVTLTFEKAGTLHMKVKVVPLDRILQG
jgi:copper(I)-binding protein